ncbi:MAG: hypothetical protein A2X86_15935 [Bdellovibrionales bacterium GWA2_49_15]|nr:MAG: hypothetical protein A2X86_15935 [Bdellovibrionales bacterium GWA2_49_15]HAZ12428.1 hypothetical protein [Bdellovibrionales bacterium]
MTQLRSVCLQIAEDENLEVLDVDSNQELYQIMANYGPTLLLYAHPKKCAMGLQLNSKIIKKVQAKTVLITDKIIPLKTLDKFMKLGLTDCITEPISPKSLLYKIKLLVRSLPNVNDQELEYRTISNSDAAAKSEKDLALNSKGAAANPENNLESHGDTAKAKAQDERAPAVKQKNIADVIDTNYRGDITENTPKTERDEDRGNLSEDSSLVETYYKGDISENFAAEETNMIGESSNVEDVGEQEIEKLKRSFELEVESAANNHEVSVDVINDTVTAKAKHTPLRLEQSEEEETREGEGPEILDSYLKSKQKRSKTILVESDFSRREKKTQSLDSSPLVTKKKRASLEIESDSENYLDQRKNELKAKKLADAKSQGLDIEEEDADTSDAGAEGQAPIDEYLRHKNAKQKLLVEESHDKKPREKRPSPEIDAVKKKKLFRIEQAPKDGETLDETESTPDDLSERPIPKQKPRQEESETAMLKRLKKEIKQEAESAIEEKKPVLLQVMAKEKTAKDVPPPLAESEAKKKKAAQKLAIVEESENNLKKGEASPANELKKRKLETATLLEKEKKAMNGPNQRAEYIEKYYNQKKVAPPEVSQSWDGLANREKTQAPVLPLKPQGEKSLIIQKEDLGEQTIDYKKIKEEFAVLDSAFADQVKTRYQIIEEGRTTTAPTPFHGGHNPTGGGPGPSYSTQEITDENGNVETIYCPNSKGIEYAIRALYLYTEKDTKDLDILTYLGKTIYGKLKGRVSFLSKGKKSDAYIELFNGHLHFCPSPNASDEIKPQEILIASQIVSVELWEAYKVQNLNTWAGTKLPSWSDETFQKDNLTYIYPYYEGTDCMGFAVVDFADKFDPIQASLVEILCESARSIYLYNYHLTGKRGQYQGRNVVNGDDSQGGMLGRFKGLFGKKAG